MKSLEKVLALVLVAGCGASQNQKNSPSTGGDDDDNSGDQQCPECQPPDDQPPAAKSACTAVNLVSDSRDLAPRVDADLINSWGLERGDKAFVIANEDSGKVSIFDRDGLPVVEGALRSGALDLGDGISGVIRVRLDLFSMTQAAAPTDQPVDQTGHTGTMGETAGSDMQTMPSCGGGGDQKPSFARYIFASTEGKLIAVDSSIADVKLASKVIVDSKGAAAYTGVAVIGDRVPLATDVTSADDVSAARILAVDFKNRRIDVFDSTFATVPCGTGSAAMFVDPNMADGYSPFNVVVLDNRVFVSYAKVGEDGDEEKGAGLGMISEFALDGTFVRRLATAGTLNAPWGMALAPANFCSTDEANTNTTNVLLVGNFGDGHLMPLDIGLDTSDDARLMAALLDDAGAAIAIDGLWGIKFGDDTVGLASSLYFAAGPADEAHGVFGRVEAKIAPPSDDGSGH